MKNIWGMLHRWYENYRKVNRKACLLWATHTSVRFLLVTFPMPLRYCFARMMLFSGNCLVNGDPGIAVFSRAEARAKLLKRPTRLHTVYQPIDGINLHNVYMRKCMFHNALRYCCCLCPMISKLEWGSRAMFVCDAIKILDRIFVVRRNVTV